MNYKIVEKVNKKYIEVKQPITCESDVLDIIGICFSNDFRVFNNIIDAENWILNIK